jgi:hypothetical protein
MFRPRIPFDPTLRLAEMAAIQLAFYFAYLLSVMLLDYFQGLSFTRDQVVNHALYRITTPLGRAAVCGQFAGGAAAAALFSALETRARHALDFVSTAYFLHALVATVFCGLPRSLGWWLWCAAGWGGSTLLAEALSARVELQEIPLAGGLPAVLERPRDADARA